MKESHGDGTNRYGIGYMGGQKESTVGMSING